MAKDDFLLEINWEGLDEMQKLLDRAEKNVDRILLDEYTRFGQLAEEGTKALVHRDEGNLEDSINFDRAKRTGDGISVEGGSNLPYAVRRHEEPYRRGVHDKYSGDKYYKDGRGKRTRSKPNWRGYEPGRKYMENAIKAIEPDYDRMNERILRRVMGGKK